MKGFNLRIQDLREDLVKDINASQLPVGVVTMVLSEILSTMKSAEVKMIDAENKAYAKELAEKEGAEDGKKVHED